MLSNCKGKEFSRIFQISAYYFISKMNQYSHNLKNDNHYGGIYRNNV